MRIPKLLGPAYCKSPASLGTAGSAQSGGIQNPFKQLDKNGDGKLNRDELPAALFDKLDQDHDGFVTEEELKSLWRQR